MKSSISATQIHFLYYTESFRKKNVLVILFGKGYFFRKFRELDQSMFFKLHDAMWADNDDFEKMIRWGFLMQVNIVSLLNKKIF